MNHIDSSASNQQRFFTSNRTNFQIHTNSDIILNFKPIQQQTRSDIKYIDQKNRKLKEDNTINKSKLMSFKNITGQTKTISSMDQQLQQHTSLNNILVNNQIRQPINVNKLHSRQQNTIIPHTKYINTIQSPHLNQQNNMGLANGLNSSSPEVLSLLARIREYEQKIELLLNNEKIYQRQISQYKQRINKIQSVLYEKQSTIVQQKSTIAELSKRLSSSQEYSQIKQSLPNITNNKTKQVCKSCTELTLKLSQLTKQITQLTNQLNIKNQKIRSLQKYERLNISLQNEIKIISSQYQLSVNKYEQQISSLKMKISNYQSVNSNKNNQESKKQQQYYLKQQLSIYQEQINRLTEEIYNYKIEVEDFNKCKAKQSTMIKNLSEENQRLAHQVEGYMRELDLKNDTSQISDRSLKQESILVEYERSIQILQQEIYGLRQQLNTKQFSNNQSNIDVSQFSQQIAYLQQQFQSSQRNVAQYKQYNQHLTSQNTKYHERILEYQQQINALYTEINGLKNQNQGLRRSYSAGASVQQKYKIEQSIRLTVEKQYNVRTMSLQKQIRSISQSYNNLLHVYNQLQQEYGKIIGQDENLKSNQTLNTYPNKQQAEYQRQIAEVKHQLQCSKKMIAELFAKIEENTTEENQKERNLQLKYKKHYDQLIRTQTEQIQKLNDQINSLINKVRLPNSRSQEQFIFKQQQISRLHTLLNQQQQISFSLRATINQLQSISSQYKQKYQQTYQSLCQAEQYIEKTEIRLNSLQNQLNIASIPDISRRINDIGYSNMKQSHRVDQDGNIDQSKEIQNLKEKENEYFDIVNAQRLKIIEHEEDMAHNLDKIRYLEQEIERLNTVVIRELRQKQQHFLLEIREFRTKQERYLYQMTQLRTRQQRYSPQNHQFRIKQQRYLSQIRQLSNRQPETVTVVDNTLIDKLRMQIQNLNKQINDFKIIVAHLQAERYSYQNTINDLRQQLTSKVQEITQLHQVISTQQNLISNLKVSITDTKDEFSKYIPNEEQPTHQINQQLLQKIRNYQKMLQQLSEEKNSLFEHLKHAQDYIFVFQQKNYEQIVAELSGTIRRLQGEKGILLNKQRQMERMMHQKGEFQNNSQNQQRQTQQQKQKILLYTKQIDILKQRISFLETQITRLQQINHELQQNFNKLKQQSQNNQRLNSSEIEKYKILILELESERQQFLNEVETMKNNLLVQQNKPHSSKNISQSRVRVDEFIKENHRIMEKLRRAEHYISELQLKCQQYLNQIQRLKSNGITSIAASRRTIRDILQQQTPSKKLNINQQIEHNIVHINQANLRRINELEDANRGFVGEIQQKLLLLRSLQAKILQLERENELLNQNYIRVSQALSTKQLRVQQISAFDNQKREFERLIVKLENQKAILGSENQRLNEEVKIKGSEIILYENKWHQISHNLSIIEGQKTKLVEQVKLNDQVIKQSNQLKNQIQNLKKRIIQLQSSISIILNQNQTLKTKVLTIPVCGNQIQTLQSQLLKKNIQFNQVSSHLKQAEQFIALNETVFIQSSEQNNKLKQRLLQFQKNVLNLEQHNINLQKELLNAENNKIEPEVRVQTKIVVDEEKINLLTYENRNLTMEINRLLQQIQIIKNLQTSPVKSLQDQVKQMTVQNNNTIRIYEIKLKQKDIQLQNHRRNYQTIKTQKILFENKLSQLTTKVQLLQNQIQNINRQLLLNQKQYSTKISNYDSQVLSLKRQLSIFQQINIGLNSQLQAVNAAQSKSQIVQSQLNQLKSLLNQKTNQIEQITIHLQQAQQFIAKNQSQFIKSSQQNTHLKHKLLELEHNLINLNNINHLLQQQADRNNEMIKNLEQNSKPNEQQQIKISLLSQEINRLKHGKQQYVIELQDKMKQIGDLGTEIIELKKIEQEYKILKVELQNKNQQFQKVSDQLAIIFTNQKQDSIQLQQLQLTHKQQIQTVETQKRFLEDSIAQLNSLVQKDRKTLSDLQTNYKAQSKSKQIIQNKLKQAEEFIMYLQEQQQNQNNVELLNKLAEQNNVFRQKISNLENQNRQVLERLVHAESRVMELQQQLKNDKLRTTDIISKQAQQHRITALQFQRLIQQLKQQNLKIKTQSQKSIDSLNKKNQRINQQLQQTVFRVSEQHIHLSNALAKTQKQKQQVQNQLQQVLNKQTDDASKNNQTNARILEQMRVTITRIGEENRMLLEENREIEKLREQIGAVGQQNKGIKSQLQTKSNQLNDILTKQTQYSISINQIQQSCKKLTQTNTHLIQQNEQLKSQLLTVSQTLNQSSSQTANHNNNYSQLAQSLNQITLSLQQKSQLINSLQTSLRNQRNKTVQFESEKSFFQKKLYEAEEYISQTQKDKIDLVKKYDMLRDEIQKIKLIKIEQHENQNDDDVTQSLHEQKSSIQFSNIKQQNQPAQLLQLQQTITIQQLLIKQLRQKIQGLQQQSSKSHSEMAFLTAEIQRLNNVNTTSYNQLGQKVNQTKQVNSKYAQIQKQLKDEREINNELKNALENAIQTESNSHHTLNELNSKMQSADRQIQKLKDNIKVLENEKAAIELNGRDAFTRELQAHKKLNNDLIIKNQENVKQLNLLREKALQTTDLKDKANALETLQKDFTQVQSKLKQAEAHISYLYGQQYKKDKPQEAQKLEIQTLVHNLEEQIRNKTLLSSQIQQKQKYISQLIQEAERIQKQVITPKQQQIGKLSTINKSLQKQNKKIHEQLASELKLIEDIKLSLQTQGNNHAKQQQAYQTKIKSLEISLNDKNSQIKQFQNVVALGQETAQIKQLYQQQIKIKTNRIQQLSNENLDIQSRNNKLTNIEKNITNKLQQLQNNKQKLEKENLQLMTLHEHLLEQISDEHIKVEKKEQQLTNIKKNVLQKEKLIHQLQNDLNSANIKLKQSQKLKSKLFQAEKYILDLQNRLTKTDKQLKKSIQLKAEFQSSQQLQLSHMSTDLKQLSQLLGQRQQELLTSNNELMTIKTKILQLEQKIDEEENHLRQKNQESIQNSHQITVLNDRLKENEQELLETKFKNKDLEIRNNELLLNLQRLNHEFNKLEEQNIKCKEVQQKFTNLLEQHRVMKNDAAQQKKSLEDEIQDLKLKRLQKQQQIDVLNDRLSETSNKVKNQQIDIQNYKRIQQQKQSEKYQQEIQLLKENQLSNEKYMTEMEKNYSELQNKTKQLENQRNSLILTDKQKSNQIKSLQEQMTILQRQSLNNKKSSQDVSSTMQNMQKLINKLTKYVQQNDSLDIYQQENIERDFSSNSIFKQLYQTIKYKFKLLNAIDHEKNVRLSDKQREISQLKTELKRNQIKQKQMIYKLYQAQILQTSYQQVSARVFQIQQLNLALNDQVSMLNNQLSIHKSQIQQFQNKIQNQSSSLSEGDNKYNDITQNKQFIIDQKLKQQNLKLRKQLEDAQYQLHKIRHNHVNSYNQSPILSPLSNKLVNNNSQMHQLFLKDCSGIIEKLEDNLSLIQNDMILNRDNIQRILASSISGANNNGLVRQHLGSKRSEDSWMMDKIQQLEQKLLLNDQKLKQHQRSTENELITLLRQVITNPSQQAQHPLLSHPQTYQSPLTDSKQKASKYLSQLQQILIKKQIEHSEQIEKYKNFMPQTSGKPVYQTSGKPVYGVGQISSPSKLKSNVQDEYQDNRNFDVEDLLHEIKGLNDHIQIYHEQAHRRKEKYRKSIEELLKQIQDLKAQFQKNRVQHPANNQQLTNSGQLSQASKQPSPLSKIIDQLVNRTKNILQHQHSEDFDQKSDYLNDDDYIMSNNYIQYIKSNKGQLNSQSDIQRNNGGNRNLINKNKQFVNDLGSIAEEFQNKQSSYHGPNQPSLVQNKILNLSNNVSKDEILSKPIFEYILQNKEFDQQEIKLLKKKISDIQLKNNQQKLQLIKLQHDKIAQILQRRRLLSSVGIQSQQKPFNIETISTALATNLTKQQIQNIVSDILSQQLVTKLQQILSSPSLNNSSSSFLKNDNINSVQMMQAILDIKIKHYPEPTPLSEQTYQHLIKLLSSKDDSEFYNIVDSFFLYLAGLENDFLNALRQKQEMYQKHTEKMNEVLGGNQDSSQDFGQEDEQYYKRALQINRQDQLQIQKLKKQQTQSGINQQLNDKLKGTNNQN